MMRKKELYQAICVNHGFHGRALYGLAYEVNEAFSGL